MNSPSRTALRISLGYAVIGAVWILFSDRVVALLFTNDPLGIQPEWWQSIKGLLFVFVTTAILYSLLSRHFNSHYRTLRAHRESEERWRLLLNQTPEPVIIEDGSKITFVNRKGVEMLGASQRSDVLERRLQDFIKPEDISVTFADTAESRPYVNHFDICRLDGAVRHVEAHTSAISIGGRKSLLSVWLDVTDREEYERRLIEAKIEAEETARMKSTILANMSHEIRTPLTAILGFAEMIQTDDGVATDEAVELILKAGRRLRETLESILMLAELDSGELVLEPKEVDVREVVHSTAELIRLQAVQKGLEFRVATPDEPVWAEIYPTALAHILSNLFSNAVKFTKEGYVNVHVEHRSDVIISVEDTGVGVDEQFLPFLFEDFRQESAGLTRQYEGSGLGLSIVRRFCEMIGATIEVRTEQHVGSTFTVRIPTRR